MAFWNLLSFRAVEGGVQLPHITIRTEMPVDEDELRELLTDWENLIDPYHAPTYDIIAFNPETGDEVYVSIDDPDMRSSDIDLSPLT